MLVVFGANGRTGLEIVRQAVARGLPVRPVVKDDRDARNLGGIVPVNQICYADADHPESLGPVLEGAEQVVIALLPRTAGPGAPRYSRSCAANVLKAAAERGIVRVLHLSVVGAFRWSPHEINRESFKVDREVRVLKDHPWTMMRVSCYHDEILEGHVWPPDGGRPHPIHRHARYSPVHRTDVAKVVLDMMPGLVPNRTHYVGGPTTYTGVALMRAIRDFVRDPGTGRRTRYPALAPGDLSVMQETTLVAVGQLPQRPLEASLADPAAPPEQTEAIAPVYGVATGGRHPADEGRDLKLLRGLGEDLRWVLHDQLVADLRQLGVAEALVTLDLRRARARDNDRAEEAHDGMMVEITGVRAVGPRGELLHAGAINFLRDALADEFRIWWEREGTATIPDPVWRALDLGVQRRLREHPRFRDDPRFQQPSEAASPG